MPHHPDGIADLRVVARLSEDNVGNVALIQRFYDTATLLGSFTTLGAIRWCDRDIWRRICLPGAQRLDAVLCVRPQDSER